MRRRYPIPELWLLTDPRAGDPLPAVARLPRGSGVILRHEHLPLPERRALFERLRRVTRERRLLLLIAGPPALARRWRADGAFTASRERTEGFRAAPVHDALEAVHAARARADVALVSPVFPTRSHPGAPTLGPVRLGLLLRRLSVPAIALGGMTPARFKRLHGLPLHGWAAIDAFRT